MASISEDAEEALLRARVADACDLCERRSCPRFVGFLDERRQATARAVLRTAGMDNVLFYGGFPDAERTLLGVFPSFYEPTPEAFPLAAVAFHFRPSASLSHRDFLGALLGAGIRREKLGDIVCSPGLAVVIAEEELAPFLAETVVKVGSEGVRAEYPYTAPITVTHETETRQDTVASPRLDAVLRAALRSSREEAVRRIEAGAVALNHRPCLSVSATVTEGDLLSVRGAGRFRVETLGPVTKKGRIHIVISHSI